MNNNNAITEWSYKKPTEQGDYLVCYGDVETESSVTYERFYMASTGTTLGHKEELFDSDGVWLKDYSSSCKYARLIYTSSELKRI